MPTIAIAGEVYLKENADKRTSRANQELDLFSLSTGVRIGQDHSESIMRIRPSAAFLLATLILAPLASETRAQEAPPAFHESPFAVSVNRVTQADMMAYVRKLSQDLSIGVTAIDSFDKEEAGKFVSEVQRPVTGSLFFLQKAMMPSVAIIEFSQVQDEQEYENLVRRTSKESFGTEGKLTGEDGKHKISSSYTNKVPLEDEKATVEFRDGDDATEDVAENTEEQEKRPTRALSISIGSGSGSGIKVTSLDQDDSNIIEEDGIKYREYTNNSEMFYRYHGHLSYSSTDESLWEMSLPTRDGVLKDASREVDMGAEVYIDRIPTGLKTLGWNMLYGGLSTEMQQRDGEPDVDYNFRSSGGQLALAIAKAGMFDSDHITGAIEFATETKPIKAHLTVDARSGSELSKRLSDLSAGESRFAAIIKDDSAVTMHFSARLPEESINVFKTGAEYLKDKLIEEAGSDVDLVISGAEIAETLVQIADQTHLEWFMKLGWTEPSGGVIYGGMRVGDNPELLQSVLTLLTPQDTPQETMDRFDLAKRGDLDVIEFLIPSSELDEDFPVRLSHLYIAHANSCLWICLGGENSFQILQRSIDRCSAQGLRASTRIFSGEIDLQKWMSYPQDDATGLTALPRFADAGMAASFSSELDVDVPTGNLMQRVIALGGRQDIRLHLDSGSSGITLKTEIGKAFGNYLAARWMQAADMMMQNMQGEMEIETEPPTEVK